MSNGFFMVLADNSSHTTMRHQTYNQAIGEATRLAGNNPGVRFFVLQSLGAAVSRKPVDFEKHEHDDIPF